MDPLVVLPTDVVELVFEHVDFEQRLVCSRVSRSWHAFILDHCHSLSIDMRHYYMEPEKYSENLLLWLKRVKGVRHFTMRFYTQSFAPDLIDTIANARWSGLRSLSISASKGGAWLPTTDAQNVLAIVRDSLQLRKLTLSFADVILTRQDMITLLATAQCLTHFEYRQIRGHPPRSTNADTQPPVQAVQCHALTHLTWITSFHDFLYDLLPLCPNLETLTLSDSNSTTQSELENMMSLILLKKLPRLHTFAIGEPRDHLLKKTSSDLADIPGLRHLTLVPEAMNMECQSYLSHIAAELFQAHQMTLLSFAVDISAANAYSFWTQITRQLTAPLLPLTYLSYNFHSREDQGTALEVLFYRLLERCPHLDTLNLWHVPWNDHQLLRILSASDTLSRVKVQTTRLDRGPEADDWLDGVSYTLPALTHLALHHHISDSFYHHLNRLENLKTLAISSQNWISPTTLTDFFRDKTPRLERVDLDGLYGAFNGKVAAALAAIPSLHEVIIDDDASITEAELRVLYDHGKIIRQRLNTPLFPV
ncbi:hypothetical protein BCR43DRAFT_528115 [Syncephalastrum racemosum]|uniref:F-box domain-containing protein n=1 Tax=Syncephalastrum racemosum TaxID=13706 RepID=A0A1X2H081_SYNRA|nr:hypothetical protein BCR43DRAFT_528115 [Syncephalastrum racemosum]